MIPVNVPLLDGRELDYVSDCIRSGWVSSEGEYITRFEKAWAAYCQRAHGAAVCNGTVALDLALAALKIGPGDEVILPSFTIISCAQAVTNRGAKPVLVDSDPKHWGMDTEAVKAKMTKRTKAIMPVHIYGHPVDMDPILDLAEDGGMAVVEDAAEAHGAEYQSRRNGTGPQWRRCGSLGTISTFSFYANKLVTTGEGGMLMTDDAQLDARCRYLRNLAFEPSRRFHHREIGFNFRMTNIQAALGLAQAERITSIVERKRSVAARYTKGLAGLPVQLPTELPWARSVYWMYGMVLDDDVRMDATQAAAAFQEKGVQTRPFFLGMHEQPVFHDMGLFKGERYPVAERLARRGLYLPSGVALSTAQADAVLRAAHEVLA